MESTSIGLDIGASAVRAAEISMERNGRTLRRFAQVGLPAGAVIDGEVVNGPVVSEALRRLWSEGGFSTDKVILGVSGHRVIVRQADMPALDEEDLRSALRFDAQELIPIPMEEASFDFTILDRGDGPGEDGKSTMRILMVAAHRDLLRSHMVALKAAGLQASAIDVAPLALMRILPPAPAGGGGVEAVVAIGAELTTVAVRDSGVPRFIRSLAVGGNMVTAGIATAMHVDGGVAERLKREAVTNGSIQVTQARRAIAPALRELAEEVRATVDFFVAQSDGADVARVLITGGASQTEGLLEALEGQLSAEVQLVDPFASLKVERLDLSESSLRQARATAATAVGLALWPLEPETSRMSILPEEVAAARRARRMVTLAAVGTAGLAGVLGITAAGQALAVSHARGQVRSAQRQVVALHGQVSTLQAKTAVHGQAEARAHLVITALTGDIDWVRLVAQLQAVAPPNLTIASFQASRATASVSTSAAASSATDPSLGTLTFSVTGSGGLPSVAAWLDGLQKDHSLRGTWVSGISVTPTGGTVSFSSTTSLTTQSESNRAQAVKP